MHPPIITIDGPSGSGKGTLSLLIAEKLGWHLLDSGAIYRLCALHCQQLQVDIEDQQAIVSTLSSFIVEFKKANHQVVALLNNEEVTALLRTEEVGLAASQLARFPLVRAALLDQQKAFAQLPGLVADGRDMGTTVFPAANIKFYLTASAEKRAERRFKQLQNKGDSANLAAILSDIQLRDARDQSRASSPLVPATDAIIIDSSEMDIEAVYNHMMSLIKTTLTE